MVEPLGGGGEYRPQTERSGSRGSGGSWRAEIRAESSGQRQQANRSQGKGGLRPSSSKITLSLLHCGLPEPSASLTAAVCVDDLSCALEYNSSPRPNLGHLTEESKDDCRADCGWPCAPGNWS